MKDLTVKDWMDELNQGYEFRSKYGLEGTWMDNEAMFYNVKENMDNSGPNIIMSTGDSLLSTLNVPYPYVSLEPTRYDATTGARVLERIDNKLIYDLKLRREASHATLSAYLYGVGFWKIGYDSEFGWSPDNEVSVPQLGKLGMSFTQMDRKGRRIEFGGAKPGMPWVESVLPHDIIVPWGTLTLERCPWIAHRIVRHIDSIMADPKYENKSGLEPNISMEDFVNSYLSLVRPYRMGEALTRTTDIQTKSEYIELFEIHDRRTGKVFVIATGWDEFLRNEDDALQINGLPFVEIGFTPAARSIWRTPDATYLRQAQYELSDITIQSTKQRRLNTMKLLFQDGSIDEHELVKLLSATVGAAVKVKGGFDLDKVVKVFQQSQNPQIYLEAEQVRRNSREVIGMSRNQAGEYEQTGRRSATEAGIVDRNSQLRTSRRAGGIESLYVDAFCKINPMLIEFWRSPRVIDVLGPDGVPTWLTFVGPQLKGEYSYTISFSESPVKSLQARKQEAMGMYAQMIQDPAVDPIQLRRYLANAFNDVSFSQIFRPGVLEGDPRAALQLQMQQQGVQEGGGGVSQDGGLPQGAAMQGLSGGPT